MSDEADGEIRKIVDEIKAMPWQLQPSADFCAMYPQVIPAEEILALIEGMGDPPYDSTDNWPIDDVSVMVGDTWTEKVPLWYWLWLVLKEKVEWPMTKFQSATRSLRRLSTRSKRKR